MGYTVQICDFYKIGTSVIKIGIPFKFVTKWGTCVIKWDTLTKIVREVTNLPPCSALFRVHPPQPKSQISFVL